MATETATHTEPAAISAVWRHAGETPLTLGEADAAVLAAAQSTDGRAQLPAFDRVGDRSAAVTSDGCWRVVDQHGVDAAFETAELGPGGTQSVGPAVYGTADR